MNAKYTRWKNSFIKEQYKYMQIQATFEHALQVNSSTAQVQSFPSNVKPSGSGYVNRTFMNKCFSLSECVVGRSEFYIDSSSSVWVLYPGYTIIFLKVDISF